MVKIEVFKITGLSPILMNNPSAMFGDGGDNEPKASTKKKISPEEEAALGIYANDSGQLFVPSIAFRSSLWNGSSYQKIGKHSARSRIDAGVFVVEEECPICYPETEDPVSSYEIDSRTVVIKTTKGRILRHRAKVPEWECKLPLEIDDDFISPDQVLTLFNQAGKVAGVLDYRPNCHGPFGRYKVELAGPNGNGKRRKKS